MSNIYAALENAGIIPRGIDRSESPISPSFVKSSSSNNGKLAMEEEMVALYHKIDSLLPGIPKRVIQFIGSREGEGTSTIIRHFGSMAAKRFSKSVLIMDTNYHQPVQHNFFKIKPALTLEDVFRDGQSIDKAIYKVRTPHLFISLISQQSSVTPQIFNSAAMKDLLADLKRKFDLIVIDSTPVAVSSEGIALSGTVDGVVLVLRAEVTRWPVAENVKDTIVKNGGKIIGVVVNKRRYYIPDFIYKRL